MESPGPSELTFTGFILSLASTAALHFGDIPNPATGRKETPDLEAAARIIEIVEMLQQKTRGNLIPEEERLVEDLLYELRMRFVQSREGERRIIEP
jgi:hypothetical protein